MRTDDPRYGEHSAAELDRVTRNTITLVKVEPAEPTVIDIIQRWAEDCRVGCEAATIVELAERLRVERWRLAFAENGVLVGSAVVEALREQTKLTKTEEWPARNRLRILADQVQTTLTEYGLL